MTLFQLYNPTNTISNYINTIPFNTIHTFRNKMERILKCPHIITHILSATVITDRSILFICPHMFFFVCLIRIIIRYWIKRSKSSSASPFAACSRDFSSLSNISCSANAPYRFAFALIISNGKPFTASACVKNIWIAVVVSVPKSLNKASGFEKSYPATLE